MSDARRAAVTIALGVGVAVAAACGGGDPEVIPPPDAGVDAASDGDTIDGAPPPTGPVRAPYGLDARPANPTCKAPARPPAAAPVKLERAFASVVLDAPIAMAQPPGDKARWFVAQRNGRVLTFPAANPPAAPPVAADLEVLTQRAVYIGIEGGLLGMAFHPRFAQNGRLYLLWTTFDQRGFVSEVGELTSTNGGATFDTYKEILAFVRGSPLHLGGGLAFGNDGYLYAGFGDGTDVGDDSLANGQTTSGFHSKVLRIDVDKTSAGKPYGIPSDNPFASGVGGAPEVFAWGFRNPFRLTVDRATGDIWVGDVGENQWEEINRVERGGNYGWPCREGAHDYLSQDLVKCPSPLGLTDPYFEVRHATPNTRAMVGGYVYRGAAIPGLQGTYVYADYIQQEVWTLATDATGALRSTLVNPSGPNGAFGGLAEDDDGEIYALGTLTNDVYKLVAAAPGAPSSFPDRLSKTGCVEPAAPARFASGVVPYTVQASFWSDGASKSRGLALPDGATIGVTPEGDFDLPIGSVVLKQFERGGRPIETRLLVRHDDGEWAGYTYAWLDDGTDAVLLTGGERRQAGGAPWHFPSRSECMRCHTKGAGRTLGLELAQLNGDLVYAATNRISNQLATLDHIGLFAAPLAAPPDALPRLADPAGAGPVAPRARAYLHANCAGCHRTGAEQGRAAMDLRASTPLGQTQACGVATALDRVGTAEGLLIKPGDPAASIVHRRMATRDAKAMPPLGSLVTDEGGRLLIEAWVRALTGCSDP
ncbi:MAG: PQQ-dependent sugar dehydrogenase [Polyangiaceae bacterium]